MGHDHTHDHSHTVDIQSANKKAFVIGILLNVAFLVTEIVAGIINHSMALLTDAGHNAGDIASLLIALLAFNLAQKRSTKEFTYGYKKTTVLAAFVNAVILLFAIGVLGYESIIRLSHPEAVKGNIIAWVAALGIVINTVSAFLFFKGRKKDLNAKSAYLHLLSDALVSLGVVIAGIIISYTQWYWLDPVIGLVIMVVILIGTWSLLRDSFKMAVDAVPTGIELKSINMVIENMKSVIAVHHVHIWPLSTTENALTAHVVLNDQLSFTDKMKVVKEIKHELQHHNIHHSTIEIETDSVDCATKEC